MLILCNTIDPSDLVCKITYVECIIDFCDKAMVRKTGKVRLLILMLVSGNGWGHTGLVGVVTKSSC